MRVFISYTTRDPAVTDDKLKLVEARLKPIAKVFIDKLHNTKGNQACVDFELWRSDLVLNIHSPKFKSEWVQKELAIARKRHKPIVKVSIDDLLNMDPDDIHSLVMEVEKRQWPVWLIMGLSLLACLGVSILGIWLSYRFVSAQAVEGANVDIYNARGLFGDSWGGVNAIVSAFAFAGVIVTLFLQNRDLNLQRKEMARQREEFEKENKTLKYQRFENLFYNMLNLQQEIVAGLRFEYTQDETVLVPSGPDNLPIPDKRKIIRTVSGRDVFRYAFEEAEIRLSETDRNGNRILVYGYRGFLEQKGLNKYDDTWLPSLFDHYFRHLYKIVQLIDNQGFSFDESYRYCSFLRGTLSRYELVWLYYNSLNPVYVKFKNLIEKYSLLKNLRGDLLAYSYETRVYFDGLGLSRNNLIEKNFSGTDYEFFLDSVDHLKNHYLLSAFWPKNEILSGEDVLNRWKAFIIEATDAVVEKV